MNSELFEEWVREQDEKFENEGRNVALIIDNCPAHPVIENLKSITLYLLPPITTSASQPMDQGVIWSLKSKYRTHIIPTHIIQPRKATPGNFHTRSYEGFGSLLERG